MSIVGDTILCNLSSVGEYHDTCGGYHEYTLCKNITGLHNGTNLKALAYTESIIFPSFVHF